MYTFYRLTIAAIKMFLRNRQALFFTLFFPFFIMVIFGYIGFDNPPVLDVGLVTHNPTAQTQKFVEQIKAFPTFKISEGTLDDELEKLNNGDYSVVLDVPDAIGGNSQIVAYKNAGQSGQAQAVVSVLNSFIDKATISSAGIHPLFSVQEKSVNAHNLRYIDFLLPGLIALAVMQMSVFSVAFVFTQYKEKGVLKRLLATPMRPIHFVLANGVTRLFVSVAQALIFVALGILLFKVQIVGSFWLLLLCVVLGAAMFLGLGFSISGLARTVDSVPVIANLVVFPMMFLGGTFFAISNMPTWLQSIAKFLPLTFFSTALRDVMTKGAGFGDISGNILGMVIWGTILIFMATFAFRFQERDGS